MKKIFKKIFVLGLLVLLNVALFGCNSTTKKFETLTVYDAYGTYFGKKLVDQKNEFKISTDKIPVQNEIENIQIEKGLIITDKAIYSLKNQKTLKLDDKIKDEQIISIIPKRYSGNVNILTQNERTNARKNHYYTFDFIHNILDENKEEENLITNIKYNASYGDYNYLFEKNDAGKVIKILVFENDKLIKQLPLKILSEKSEFFILSNGNILFQYIIPVSLLSEDYDIAFENSYIGNVEKFKIRHEFYNVSLNKLSNKKLGVIIKEHHNNLEKNNGNLLDIIAFNTINTLTRELNENAKSGNIDATNLKISEIVFPIGDLETIDDFDYLTEDTMLVVFKNIFYLMNPKTNEILHHFSIKGGLSYKIVGEKLLLINENTNELTIYEFKDNKPVKVETGKEKLIATNKHDLTIKDKDDYNFYVNNHGDLIAYEGDIICKDTHIILKTENDLIVISRDDGTTLAIIKLEADFKTLSIFELRDLFIIETYYDSKKYLTIINYDDSSISFKTFKEEHIK